jgi:uncharacterized heparinase superfamily protein
LTTTAKEIGRYWRTASHLLPSQIFYRVWYLLCRKLMYRQRRITEYLFDKRLNTANYRTIRPLTFGPDELHSLLARSDRLILDTPDDVYRFCFMKRCSEFHGRIEWHPQDATKLWLYNLHYFEYAYDLGVAYTETSDETLYHRFRSLITDWCASNPIGDSIGWDPFPTSLRIVAWIKAYQLFYDPLHNDVDFRPFLQRMIYRQALFLESNVEYHVANNHLIENGRALLLAGLFFQDERAHEWRKKGLTILWRELERQVSDDGGQFELSPMYHCAVLLTYAEITTVLRGSNLVVPAWVDKKIRKMVQFLRLMCHPDGEISFLNDAATGMTPPTQLALQALSIQGYDNEIGDSEQKQLFTPLVDSGFYVVHDSVRRSHLIFDCGKMGPDFQPGHGHCDALSYSWSYLGERVVVDSAVDDYYRGDAWREYYRSTRAHNTVLIDGQEQSEIWGNFRVGRRAHPVPATWKVDKRLIAIRGGHNGYDHLPGHVMHHRHIALVDDTILIVFDSITGKGQHSADSFVHFHPRFAVELGEDHSVLVRGPASKFALLPFGTDFSLDCKRGCQDPLQGWYAPTFGQRFDSAVISISSWGQLPLYIGYILAPVANEKVTLKSSIVTVDTFQLTLSHAIPDQTHTIICSAEGISRE